MGTKLVVTPVELKPEMAKKIPGAAAVYHLSVKTDELVESPTIKMTFDKPFLKAIVHAGGSSRSYGTNRLAQFGNILEFSFDSPPFDEHLDVQFTIYAAEPVHVISATLVRNRTTQYG